MAVYASAADVVAVPARCLADKSKQCAFVSKRHIKVFHSDISNAIPKCFSAL